MVELCICVVKREHNSETPVQRPKEGAHPNIIIIHRNFSKGAAPLPRFANKLSEAEELRRKNTITEKYFPLNKKG
jgi:hypothetical protein